jgi:hypothetical protein
MNKMKIIAYVSLVCLFLASCNKQEVRNIADVSNPKPDPVIPPTKSEVNPVDINNKGFDFMEKMQGHWIGVNRVIADDYDWFAFDYRAISSNQIHGIFEGGTFGNLFTSFFVTNYKNTNTIMARNGGVLNGIYRTSYFVLDSVNTDFDGSYYRFVDAIGGANVMYMELRFKQDSIYWNAYTSRLGVNTPSSRHMTFKAEKRATSLAQTAAALAGYPKNEVTKDFSQGFDSKLLYVNSGETEPSSATFLAQGDNNSDVISLAYESGDPYRIDEQPSLSFLQINITKTTLIENQVLFLYLSEDPLTDTFGYLDYTKFNSVLLFPQLDANESQFLITYLHPGAYYVTIVADINGDGVPSPGDVTHIRQPINITVESQQQITIDNITVQN